MNEFHYIIPNNNNNNNNTKESSWMNYQSLVNNEIKNDSFYTKLNYNNFQSTYYINTYPNLKLKDKDSAWHHYIHCGKNESCIVKPLRKTIENYNKAIIYVYYCRPNEQRNETNLSFFIRQTILKDFNNNILYLFIINNEINEVIIPKRPNVYIIKNKNCFDFEAYGFGINYIKYLTQDLFINIQRILLINSSVTGPFCNSDNWLDKFEDNLVKENSHACSHIMYKLKEPNDSYVYRLPGYLIYFKVTEDILSILKDVLSYKKDKIDCIINGEYGFSRELIKHNYKISCLTHTNNELHTIPHRFDRDFNMDNYSLYDLIFIKLIWRSPNPPNRDSIPVKWNTVDTEINKLCNYKKHTFKFDYSSIQCAENGSHDSNCQYNWNNKETFYKIYGQSEEFIIYPIIQNKYKNLALYAHSDSDNILRDYCIQGINTLTLLGYKVIICTTCKKFSNCDNLPYEIQVYSNCNIDIQMYKLYIELNYNEMKQYSNLLLINDSILFPIHGLNNMEKSINNARNKCDYWGIWNSIENKEHIMSPFLEFKIKMLDDLKIYINNCNPKNWVNGVEFEINLVEYFNKLNYNYSVIVDYKTLGELNNYQCPIMHPDVFPKWINRSEVFAIKWKYIGNYLDLKKLNMPYLNYLLRFLHFDYNGIQGVPQQHNVYKHPLLYKYELKYFDYNFYINKKPELKNLDYVYVCNYFINNCNKDKIIFNDLLIYFDYKFYTTYYKDLKSFNFIESCNHFIEHGIKENRIFNNNLIDFDYDYYENNYNINLKLFELRTNYLNNQHRNKNILSNNCYYSKNILNTFKKLIIYNFINNIIDINEFMKTYLIDLDNDTHILFILNNNNINIPINDNISFIYNESIKNNLYYSIKHLEHKINKPIYIICESILYLNDYIFEFKEYNKLLINNLNYNDNHITFNITNKKIN